jgi:hypothetical protein
MKRIILILLFALYAAGTWAQTAEVTGRLSDTLNFKPMAYSAVQLVRYSDSVLTKFCWVNQKDEFRITGVPADTYMLRITRPTFVDYEDRIVLSPGEQRDMGTIVMVSKVNLLKEVLIREKINSIRVKGDTTEFLVDSFLTNKNASVEDLLKRLPGIQVDKNGKITAQGQTVQKVLVDGEEFFGDDPTVATRNIRAENVESVQVFDKKSEQAAFSGIDDGEKSKTINLKLKDDAKKGYFGKVKGSGGTDKRYENDAMMNAFKDKRKLALYGAMSNTNKTALSWQDADKYTGGNTQYEMGDDGMMYSWYSSGDDNINFNGRGIPETWYAGAHYSNKWKEDRHSISVNGNRKEMTVRGFDNNETKYILPDTLYFNNQANTMQNYKNANSANGTYEIKVDSLSTVRLKFNGRQGASKLFSTFSSENLNENEALVNANERTSETDGTNEMLTSSLLWNKKFKLKGRTLSLQASQSHDNNESEGLLKSVTRFYNADGSLKSEESIDQKKITSTNTNVYSARTTYTEPFGKSWFIVNDYEVSSTVSESGRLTFAKGSGSEYEFMVDTLSNSLRYDILTNRGGIALKYANKKLTASLGGKASYTDLTQLDQMDGTSRNQYFFNLFPSGRIQYKPTSTSNFSMSYNGSTRQPNLQQIQPLQDNLNPLNVYVGNPALVQSFTNEIFVNYNTFKPISGSSFYTYSSVSFIDDDFTMYDYVDAEGRRVRQTVNVDGNRNGRIYAAFHSSIRSIEGLSIGHSVNARFDRNVNFINSFRNVNNSQAYTYELNVYYEIEKKLDISLSPDFTYNHVTSTLRPDVETAYWLQGYNVNLEYQLPWKMELEAEMNYNIRQRTSDFDRNLNTCIINTYLRKKMLAREQLVFEVAGMDLLNQNLGFYRSANSNYINENTYSVIKRYFMLSLVWNFAKGPVE